jgi:hypothetical protein
MYNTLLYIISFEHKRRKSKRLSVNIYFQTKYLLVKSHLGISDLFKLRSVYTEELSKNKKCELKINGSFKKDGHLATRAQF